MQVQMSQPPAPNEPLPFMASIQAKADLLKQGYETGLKVGGEQHLRPYGLLFTGMGFSGFSANLVSDACTRALDIPFTVVKHYQFPHHVKPGWQTIAVSYSGETEETLAVTRASNEHGVPVTAFTVGGQLASIAQRNVPQPAGYQPRAAFAYTWFSILGFLEGSGILPEFVPIRRSIEAVKEVDAACGPNVPEAKNEAMQLARRLAKPVPQIYATPAFWGVGMHFAGQLNENAKKIADVDLVPECNHNDLSGWGGDTENRRNYTVVCLSHASQNAQLRKRLEFMEERYRGWGVPWYNRTSRAISSFADHVIEQARAIQFLDYTSLYVAALRGKDPAAIPDIVELKKFLRDEQ
jgi:glucose/mannose-6-phosphate isomerase